MNKQLFLALGLVFLGVVPAYGEKLRFEGEMLVEDLRTKKRETKPCFVEFELDGNKVIGFDGIGAGSGVHPNFDHACGPPSKIACRVKRQEMRFVALGKSFMGRPEFMERYNFKQTGSVFEENLILKGKKKNKDQNAPTLARERVKLSFNGKKAEFYYRQSFFGIYTWFKGNPKCVNLKEVELTD